MEETFGWGGGVPVSLLIDAEGRVAQFWIGAVSPSDTVARKALADTIVALLGS